MDWSGRVCEIEYYAGKSAHLCEALALHSETLEKVDLRPYRVCPCLFEDKVWTNIKAFHVDMFTWHGCIGPDGEGNFQDVQTASKTSKVPGHALPNFILSMSGAACVKTRRPGDPDLPPLTSADYYPSNNHRSYY